MDTNFNRREFFSRLAQCACGVGLCGLLSPAPALAQEAIPPVEVTFYTKLPDAKIRCEICPKKCEIAEIVRAHV